MIKNIFRKLPLKSLDDSFWLFVDKAEKEDIFRVNGKKMNLSRALNNQYKGPVLDYLLSEMAYLCQEFNGAAEIIDNLDFHIISRQGRYWKVLYEEDAEIEMRASAYCELRGLIFSAFDNTQEIAKESLADSVFARLCTQNPTLENREVYTFTKVDTYSLRDLKEKTISVGNPRGMNDPFESPFFDIQDKRHESLKEMFKQACQGNVKNYDRMVKGLDNISSLNNYYRIRCFVEDNPKEKINPINRFNMWAAYAGNGTGICVKYSLSSKFQDYNDGKDIRYLHAVSYVDSFEINLNKLATLEEGFYTKNRCWESENEVRLLSFNTQSEEDYIQLPLDSDSRVTDVYFGMNCSEENKEKVIEALGHSAAYYHSMEKDVDNYYYPVQYQHKLFYETDKESEQKILDWFNSD